MGHKVVLPSVAKWGKSARLVVELMASAPFEGVMVISPLEDVPVLCAPLEGGVGAVPSGGQPQLRWGVELGLEAMVEVALCGQEG